MATRSTRSAGTASRRAARKASDVIDVTFDDYEPPRSEYMGEEPRPGVYRFELTSVGRHTADNGNESVRWIFNCTDEPYAGWAGFMYTGLPGSDNFFRTQHTVRALQAGNTKPVSIDLDNPEKFIRSCKIVLGRVINEEYNEEMRGKLRTVAPDDGSVKSTKPADDEDDMEDDEEYEDDLDDEEIDEEDEDVDDEDDADDEEEDDEDEDEGDEDDEEDEPEPEPAPRRRSRASAPAKKAAPKAEKTAAAPARRRARR